MLLKLSLALMAASMTAFGQQPNVSAPPTTSTSSAPAAISPKDMNIDQLRALAERDEARLKDWAALLRYRSANAQLPAPVANEDRVVFMGDSITDNWAKDPATFFPGKPYIGRGIGGQITQQMLLRFWPDVIALHPKVVVLLAGTNDISGHAGVLTDEAIEANIMAMTELASEHGIRVVLSSILPTCEARTESRPIERILALNDWLHTYADAHHFIYVDYYPALLDDETNEFRRSLTGDCLHPNAEGYKIMAPLAEAGIRAALAAAQPAADNHKPRP